MAAAILWLAASSDVAAEDIPSSIERYLREEMAVNEIPGLSVAIVRGDEVASAAYGVKSLAGGAGMTADTLLELASLSKPLTALAAGRLEQEGRLVFDRSVAHYLPEFRTRDLEASLHITVRHLVEQTSGLTRGDDYLIPCCGQPGEFDLTLAARRLDRAQLRHAPGSRFYYANSNYILLAGLIERVSGRPFPDYMRTDVFQPLRMTSTTLSYDEAARWGLAEPHEREWGRMRLSRTNFSGWYGSSQVKSTVVDVGRWLSALLRGEEHAFGPAGRAASFFESPRDAVYQRGWFVRRRAPWLKDESVLEHSGFIWNGSTSAIVVPGRKLAVAVLMNTGTSRAAVIARGVLLRAAGLPAPSAARAPWTSQTDNWAMCFIAGSVVLAVLLFVYLGRAWMEWRQGKRRIARRQDRQTWVRCILLAAMAATIVWLLAATHRPLASLPGSLRVALPMLAVTSAAVLVLAALLGMLPRQASGRTGNPSSGAHRFP